MPGPTFDADAAVASGVAITRNGIPVIKLQFVTLGTQKAIVGWLASPRDGSSEFSRWNIWNAEGQFGLYDSRQHLLDLQNSPA
jgi:hypothetical protein